jgi:hypothetical protein
MLFLRREVLAPGRKPAAVPKGAVAPTVGPGDALKTLPNPFLVGGTLEGLRKPRGIADGRAKRIDIPKDEVTCLELVTYVE